jgi:Ca2+:H+ antiporter
MRMHYLLVFVPVALVLRFLDANPILVFAAAAVAVIPLAALMAEATEVFAEYLGPTLGGLLNASLGNAPEIIISVLALTKGLHEVVKASITGSIIGNLLFGLGVSMIAGGWRHGFQKFDKLHAGLNTGLLMLAAIGLIVPAVFHHISDAGDDIFSFETAIVLLGVYALSIVFTLRSAGKHWQPALTTEESHPVHPGEPPKWSRKKALGILTGVTVTLALVSEVLTGALEPAAKSLGLTEIFSGVVLLAMVGNAAEIYNAVRFAHNNEMDVACGIAVGAGTQVALLVAPLLVIVSMLMGQPMDLVFSPFEVIATVLAVMIVSRLTSDGECHWMEGVMLVGVYAILGMAFFNLPA